MGQIELTLGKHAKEEPYDTLGLVPIQHWGISCQRTTLQLYTRLQSCTKPSIQNILHDVMMLVLAYYSMFNSFNSSFPGKQHKAQTTIHNPFNMSVFSGWHSSQGTNVYWYQGHGINRYKPSCHKQVSDTQNVQNCHKQLLNNKTVWNCVSDILQYIIYIMTEKKLSFFFSLPSSHFIVLSSMYELLINDISLSQWFYHIYKS